MPSQDTSSQPLHGTAEFRSGYHALLMGEDTDEISRRHAEAAEMALGEARAAASTEDIRQMRLVMWTGAWLPVPPSIANGTDLRERYWRDFLLLRYVIKPPDLMDHCDGCVTEFSICHALDYKKGGLLTARHNNLRDRVANLASKAFTPT